VAGTAALLSSQGRGPRDIAQRLTSTAVDLGPPGVDDSFGWGRLDAAAAVGAAAAAPGPPSATPPAAPNAGTGAGRGPGAGPDAAATPARGDAPRVAARVRLALRQVDARGRALRCGARRSAPCRVGAGTRIRLTVTARSARR